MDSGAAVLVGGCVAELESAYQRFDTPVAARLSVAVIVQGDHDLLVRVAGEPTTEGPSTRGREYRPRLYGALVDALRAATASGPLRSRIPPRSRRGLPGCTP